MLAREDFQFCKQIATKATWRVVLLFLFVILISDSLDTVQVSANSPIPMPQVALGLIPNKDVVLPEQVSAEQVTLQFQKKLEDLEQQVQPF